MIFQWGNLKRTANSHAITFPISFTVSTYAYMETSLGLGISQFDNVVTQRTNTSCTTYCSMKTNEKTDIMWLAVGY